MKCYETPVLEIYLFGTPDFLSISALADRFDIPIGEGNGDGVAYDQFDY